MNAPAQNVVGLFVGIWPRVVAFSGTPSLLLIALVANLIAVVPTALRMQKENVSCETAMSACAEGTLANVPSD